MKKIVITISSFFFLVIVLFIFEIIMLQPVSKKSDTVTVNIKTGMNKIEIINLLKDSNVIKNKYASLVYIFITPNINLQAGTYIIDRSNDSKEIINQIAVGDTKEVVPTVNITFIEGKKFTDYAKLISTNFNIEYDDIIKKTSDKKYLKTLIDEYWFLTDEILNENIYYPLEGYLAPNTYQFYKTANLDNIIHKLLDQTENNLENYRDAIKKSGYTIHEILTIASICEKEAVNEEDRKTVSQVIHKRLNIGMNLGMDVTTYYAVFKEMGDVLTAVDLDTENAYNTRNKNFKGLPASSICNPSIESIAAAINPSDTDYTYFIADVETGKVYFASTYEDFIKYKNELITGD